MIVVPTYNGYFHLTRLIAGLEEFGTNGHKVLIVNNQTTDLVSKKYLQDLRTYKGPLDLVIEDNNGKYETGAWIYATRQYPNEEKFILIHDGCVPTTDKWLSQFEELLTPQVGCVSWVKFQPCLFYMFDHHYEYMKDICPYDNVPDGGIFGSIFMTWGKILREFDSKGYFNYPPTQKHHAEAWERIWPILFHINGYNIENLITGFDPNAIHYGWLPNLKKTFGGRS